MFNTLNTFHIEMFCRLNILTSLPHFKHKSSLNVQHAEHFSYRNVLQAEHFNQLRKGIVGNQRWELTCLLLLNFKKKRNYAFCFQKSLYLQSFRNKSRKMDYLTFKERMYPIGCFHINQVLLWEKDFDRNNLTRWCQKGLLVKLRNQYYSFPEYRQVPDFSRFVANRIYAPSYISLHSALSFYGMIPEEVVQLTSVTTLKTAKFENAFGTFHYQNVKSTFFFGYEIKLMRDRRGVLFATPEKALA